MKANGKTIDPETGEVLEDDCDVTIKYGDREVKTSTKGMQRAAEHLKSGAQLTLFEGHKVDFFDTKLKAANLGGGIVGPDVKIPKLYEKKYIIAEVTAIGISHDKKVIDGESFLLKTATYALSAVKEIDEFTAHRLLDKDDQ